MTSSTTPVPGWRSRLGFRLMGLRLFAVSYAPLAVIFAWQCKTFMSVGGWVLVAAALLALGWRTTYGQLHRNALPAQVSDVRDRGAEVSGYLAGYLLPFIAGPPNTLSTAGAYATYFSVSALIYVRSDLTFINPTLYALGWRVVEVSVSGRTLLVLCREVPHDGEHVQLVKFFGVAIRKS